MNQQSQHKRFSISSRLRSFKYAFNGIKWMLQTQHNSWIHLTLSIAVIFFGFHFKISTTEWCFLVLAIGLGFTAEAVNTAIEFMVDVASPDYNPIAGKAKDVAAGAVLIAAITSATIGVIIFLPKFMVMFGF